MPIDVTDECVGGLPRRERAGHTVFSDAPLHAALGVAESVAKRHGGQVQLRSSGDGGGVVVELRFTIPRAQA